MTEFDPLRVPLRGTHLVEAAAGTGKTHSLTALVLRLVGEGGVLPGELALVTFTEAATRELRGRVRARLDLLARRLRELQVHAAEPWREAATEPAPCADEQVEALVARWRDDPASVRRVSAALHAWDDAIVATIHAFCRRLLNDHALETGASFAEVEPTQGAAVIERALADFWRRHVVAADPAQVAWVLGWCDSPRALRRWLDEPLRVPPEQVVPAADRAGLAELERHLSALHAQGRALVARGALGRACEHLLASDALSRNKSRSPYAPERLAPALAALTAWLDAERADIEPALPGLMVLRRETCTEHQLRSRREWTPLPDEICAWAETGYALGLRYANARRVEFLQRALSDVRERLQAHKREQRITTFDDLVTDLKRVLDGPRGPQARRAIQARLKVAVVDEFQDTDAEQYAIFRALFHERDDAGLYLIGDPKQAIYRFRGGDVYAYAAAARDAAANRWTLLRNWRSDPRLIDAVNGLFDPARVPNAFVHEFIGFERARPARAPGPDAPPAAARPLTVWTAPGQTWTRDPLSARLHRAVAAEIAALVRAADGAALPSIGVLVRDRHELSGCVAELARWGIASVQSSELSVHDTPQAAELGLVLEALADPRDARKARAALATELLGHDEAALRRTRVEPQAWEAALSSLADLGDEALRLGPAALARALAQRAGPRWLARADGRRALVNLLQLGELMQQQHAALGGFAAQIDWLQRQRTLAATPFEAEQRPEPDAAAVEVMTIHKAKGLQWDVVFAPYLALGRVRERPAGELELAKRRPVRYHADGGGVHVDLGSSEWARHAEREIEETYAEAIRIAYVALTRARRRAYTCWARSTTESESAYAWLLHQSRRRDGWSRLDDADVEAGLAAWDLAAQGTLQITPLPEPAFAPLPAPHGAQTLAARVFEGAIERRFQLLSYTTLFGEGLEEQPDHDQRAPAPPSAEPGPVPSEPRGAEFGECVHTILEAIDLRLPESADTITAIERTCRRFGLDDDAEEYVRELVAATARAELDPGVALQGLAPAARRAEIEFFFPLHEVELEAVRAALALEPRYARSAAQFAALKPRWHGLMHGYVDLVYAHGGRYGLIDYKTSFLGGRYEDYAAGPLARAIRASDYDLQYLIYVVALVRHLRRRLGARFDYARDFIGVRYLFLRGLGGGHGVYRDTPPAAVVAALDRAFGGVPA